MTNKYRNISIKKEFADAIEQFVNTHPQYGYRSIAQFLEDSARDRLETLKGFQMLPPPLEHFNLDENGIRILDHSLATSNSPKGRIIDVYFKPNKALCEYDNSTSCRHVKFALGLPKVQKIFKKKGWNLPEV